MKTPRILLLTAVCTGLAWPVAAAEKPLQAGTLTLQQMQRMDANKDGVISKDEFASQSADMAAWSQADANKDGVLDKDEQRSSLRVVPIRVR